MPKTAVFDLTGSVPPATPSVARLVSFYLANTGLSEDQFAAELRAALPKHRARLSGEDIARWAAGEAEPNTKLCEELFDGVHLDRPDWRFEFGLHCLAVKDPGNWDLFEGRMWRLYRVMRFHVQHDAAGIQERLSQILEVEYV